MSTSRHLGTIEESELSDMCNSNGSPIEQPLDKRINSSSSEDDSGDEFLYPGASDQLEHPAENQISAVVSQPHPSPAQLEALFAAASAGDLLLVQRLFRNALTTSDVGAFALANDASSRTGLTALHAAASRGYVDIVQWLVDECGAMPDLEDKEGETALHKSSLHGHMEVVKYLLPDMADVHARDADGWTALHNACSKGYLDIVRWLCESGGAASEFNGVRGIDARSKGGWTPLMNAASKGHLPVVRYLLTKQTANPLIRNNWGETAYDVAAAVFEVWICEVLQRVEALQWRGTTVPYDPLSVHTTMPLILYENQRLDMRFKTLAMSGGRPRFSASGLGRQGRRAPYELMLPKPDVNGAREVPAWRTDVQLPYYDDPWTLPLPGQTNRRTIEGAERSHFWLSDWTLDVTHPRVDAEEGWQYAHFFSDPDDQWVAEKPPLLERLLNGNGAVAIGLSGQVSGSQRRRSSASSSSSSSSSTRTSQSWVRRRRWVRVMRRRLDIPPLPFLEPDGSLYHLAADGTLIPFVQDNASDYGDGEGQELGSMRSSNLISAQDYVARARYLVGTQSQDDIETLMVSAVEARRAIAKLERATTELRQGILREEDVDRKTQAEVLLNTYSRELERRRLSAGAQGLLISGQDDYSFDNDGDSSDDEFHYPGASIVDTNRPSSRQSSFTDYFSRPASSRGPADLTPHLSQAPEFRVPTHEAPQKLLTQKRAPPTPHLIQPQWERDDMVIECRECRKKFGFLTRRHCRKCGRIFCDRCSAFRVVLDPSDIVQDPAFPFSSSSGSSQRVCSPCYEEVNAGISNRLNRGGTSVERIVVDTERLAIPGQLAPTQSSSQLSDLAECPVCNRNLGDLGDPTSQESHVKNCLEGSPGSIPQSARYLVYKLPGESSLIGVECVICLDEFVKGSQVARLSCLCTFHSECVSSWLQRGRNCPVHAR